MWLRLCADLLLGGSVVLRSRAVVLCSGPDLCGSRTGLCPGSGCGRSQLLRSGPELWLWLCRSDLRLRSPPPLAPPPQLWLRLCGSDLRRLR